jgi:hypothetical protein
VGCWPQAWVEDHEIPAQPVGEAVDLRDLVFAVIAEQPDLHRVLVEVGAGKLLDPLLEYCPRDCPRVDLIGLAGLALSATRLAHQPRRDPHDALPGGHEAALEVVGDVPAVLQRPHNLRVNLLGPSQCLTVSGVIRGDLSFTTDLPGTGVDGSERVGALVGIRSNHDHSVRPFNRRYSLEWTSGGQF